MPEEHRHVNDAGRGPDEVEDGDENGGLHSLDKELRLPADEVLGVVPRDGDVPTQDDAILWNTAHRLVGAECGP